MKFDTLRNEATANGTRITEGAWVSDTLGTYIIKEIDWEHKTVLVDEVELHDDGTYDKIDTYSRTFIDMRDCE